MPLIFYCNRNRENCMTSSLCRINQRGLFTHNYQKSDSTKCWTRTQTNRCSCAVNQDMWTQPANTKLSYHAWYLPSLFCMLFCLERLKKVTEGRRRGRDGDRYWCAATALIKRYGSWALLSAQLFRRSKTHASSKDIWERNANLSRIRFPVEGIGEAWTYRNAQTNTHIYQIPQLS